MTLHFEIREKGKHLDCGVFVMAGTVENTCAGDKKLIELFLKTYPLETHKHKFWIEQTVKKEMVWSGIEWKMSGKLV